MAVRPPAVAGSFYESGGARLARQVEGAFTSPRGPGRLPVRRRTGTRSVRAIVVPHAGYIYSGPIAAWAYDLVASEPPPASVLVLGVNHQGVGALAAVSARDWETPLGRVPVDRELVAALSRGPIEVDEVAHSGEHSIEVQVPFLQYVLPAPRLAALEVSFGPLAFLTDVAAVVRKAVEGRDVLLVASTDFSHYVPADVAERADRLAIDQILQGSAAGLYEVVRAHEISMCGVAPTTVLLSVLEGIPLTPELLRWGHSGESEPMRTVVGYAAVAFRDRSLGGGSAAAKRPENLSAEVGL